MNKDSIAKLSHEISFAIFRVAETVELSQLRKELEKAAIELTSDLDSDAVAKLVRLVELSQVIEEISEINSAVLLRELGNLDKLLVPEATISKVEADISKIFNKGGNPLPFSGNTSGKSVEKRKATDGPGKRQAEILEFIRQFPNGCQISDISRNFEEVSKRTIRNDIGALIEDGQAQRIGGVGPNSYIQAIGVSGGISNKSSNLEEEVILLREPEEEDQTSFD
ncbi:MAG: DeoR family transcriptional regulator [Candidatus Colwellbacteria bacterium]